MLSRKIIMKSRDFSYFLIPLVAAFALYLPLSSTPPSRPDDSSQSASSAQGETATAPTPSPSPNGARKKRGDADRPAMSVAQSNAASIIHQFFGVDRETCERCGTAPCLEIDKMTAQYRLEFLVATLPDPMESRLGYLFDRNLDAVQRAIESAGFVLDRFDLPWRDQNGASKESEGFKTGDDERRQRPGVILFRSRTLETVRRCPGGRRVNPGGRLLVLFVVGETPTTGVNKTALTNAFDQIALLSRWYARQPAPELACLPEFADDGCESPVADLCWPSNPNNPPKHEIRLMGPTFSGSEDSIELAIQSWREAAVVTWLVQGDETFDFPIFSVISGSATSVSQCRFCNRIKTRGQPVFQSTVLQSQVSLEAYIRDLIKKDGRASNDKIAILKESNTVYGQSSMLGNDQSGGMSPMCPDVESLQRSNTVNIPFPFHISQLRSASARARSSQTKNNAPDLLNIRRPLLPLLLEDEHETKEVVPLFSKLEPASIELVLSTLLDELNREQVRHIGIIATDVKDCIFLVGEIRKHCPNATVFVFFGDILYLRPEVNVDLRGTVVITPYPLFGPNQFWSYPFIGSDTRFQFPTHVTQGVYNATLALLGMPDLLEYGDPFDAPNDVSPSKPALWASVVGSHSFMPVKTLRYEDLLKGQFDRYPLRLRRGAEETRKPVLNLGGGLNSKTATTIIWLLIAIGFVVPVAALLNLLGTKYPALTGDFSPARQLVRSRIGELFSDSFHGRNKMRRRFYQLMCCLSLLVIYLPTMWVFLLPSWTLRRLAVRQDHRPSFTVVTILIGVVMSISLVSALWLWGSIVDSPVRGQMGQMGGMGQKAIKKDRVFLLAILVGVLSLVLVLCAGFWLMWSSDTSRLFFFFVRSTDLVSGVSPLLPLLLVGAAALLCAYCELRRWNLSEMMHPVIYSWMLKDDKLPATKSFLNFDGGEGGAGGGAGVSAFPGLASIERLVINRFDCPFFRLPGWPLVMLVLVLTFVYVFYYRFIPTLENFWYDCIFRTLFIITASALALAFLRFFSLWTALKRLLRRLSSYPLFTNAASDKFAGLMTLNLTSPAPNYTSLGASIHQAAMLCRAMKSCPPELRDAVGRTEETLNELLQAKAGNDGQGAAMKRGAVQVRLAAISREVARLLEPAWKLTHEDSRCGIPDGDAIRLAEVFLAGRVVAFLHYALAHMQNLVVFVTGGMLLLLLAVTSYPFQPRDLFLLVGWLLILSVVAATLLIFVQMNRDKVLSLLSGGEPGKVTWNRDFVWRVLIHGLLPILALLSAQFPEVLQQLLSWLRVLQGGGN
jgi:hypothetical protein